MTDRTGNPGTSGRKVLILLQAVVVAAVLFFVGRVLASRIGELNWSEIRFSPVPFAGALLLFAAAKLISAAVFGIALHSFGWRLPWRTVIAARMASLPGRYVPGRFAAPGGLTLILNRFGVPVPVAVGTSLLPTVINLLTGAVLSLPLLWMTGVGDSLVSAWPAFVLLILLLSAMLHPQLLLRLLNIILARMGRSPIPVPSGRHLLKIVGICILRYFASGMVIWLLVLSIEPVGPGILPLVVIANTSSFVAGFVVFFMPAGIGVRESALLVILGPYIAGIALVAVVFRVLDAVTDLVLGLAGLLSVRGILSESGSGRGDAAKGADGVES